MRTFLAALTLLPLAACATPGIPVAGGGECRNDGLDRFVGQKATAETGAELLKISSASTLRWGAPGMAMTMDFRADRLTVSYDAAMLITSARCG
ncbi:MAG: I78 family peptidase inhibitor [Sphingobium sp.]|uniref:I78 family peptidase inhibitor n=1 Tax=Sphingobium sp. TaxID=1912891 RepID=UPI0029A66A49|nr:I78 family peptidase inhibitor [Sphingobium sp.]MDX3909699.1 I78 family peptidase inhibitor [Sphingobium sp.]